MKKILRIFCETEEEFENMEWREGIIIADETQKDTIELTIEWYYRGKNKYLSLIYDPVSHEYMILLMEPPKFPTIYEHGKDPDFFNKIKEAFFMNQPEFFDWLMSFRK